MLRIIGCYLVTYVAGWPVGHVIKGQAVRVECITSLKDQYLIFRYSYRIRNLLTAIKKRLFECIITLIILFVSGPRFLLSRIF